MLFSVKLFLFCHPQLAGYNDEVLDVKFLGPGDSHIVVATNSPQLKVFELSTSHCQILYGHTGVCVCVCVWSAGLWLFLLPWILLKCFCSVGGVVVLTDFLFVYLRLAAFPLLTFAFISVFLRPSALDLVLHNMKAESFHKAWTFQ